MVPLVTFGREGVGPEEAEAAVLAELAGLAVLATLAVLAGFAEAGWLPLGGGRVAVCSPVEAGLAEPVAVQLLDTARQRGWMVSWWGMWRSGH